MTARTDVDVEAFLTHVAREAWEAFKRAPVIYVVSSGLAALIGIASIGLLAGPLAVGSILVAKRKLHGRDVRPLDVLEGLRPPYLLAAIFAFLLVALAIALGMVLLVVPGLAACVVSCFVFHELAYRDTTAIDAIRGSFLIAKAHLLHVLLLLVGVGILNAIGQVVVVGLLVTVPLTVLAVTIAYEELTGQTTGDQLVPSEARPQESEA